MKIKRITACVMALMLMISCFSAQAADEPFPAAEIKPGELTEFEAEDYAEIADSYVITDDISYSAALAGFSGKFIYVPISGEPNLAITPPNDKAPGLKIHFNIDF